MPGAHWRCHLRPDSTLVCVCKAHHLSEYTHHNATGHELVPSSNSVLQILKLQQELAAVVADRDQLRAEVERVGADCTTAKQRLASVEAFKAGIEVCLMWQSSR